MSFFNSLNDFPSKFIFVLVFLVMAGLYLYQPNPETWQLFRDVTLTLVAFLGGRISKGGLGEIVTTVQKATRRKNEKGNSESSGLRSAGGDRAGFDGR